MKKLSCLIVMLMLPWLLFAEQSSFYVAALESGQPQAPAPETLTPTMEEATQPTRSRSDEAIDGYLGRNALMITYGQAAPVAEGDNDHVQVIWFKVPKSVTTPLFLRLYDADVGGQGDYIVEDQDTFTRFSLYGGAMSLGAEDASEDATEKLHAGNLLHQFVFGVDPMADNAWYTFALLNPNEGLETEYGWLFKLVVEGMQGNDGNAYDVILSQHETRNVTLPGIQVFNYSPTIHMDQVGLSAELRFKVPVESQQLLVRSFDTAKAQLTLETLEESFRLDPSNQGEFIENQINLPSRTAGQSAAVVFHNNGGENPNDATFNLKTAEGQPIAIELPIRVRPPNFRPKPVLEVTPLADCRSMRFDARQSNDPNQEPLRFEWSMGDSSQYNGPQFVHRYAKPGVWPVTLHLKDSSGWVNGNATVRLPIRINATPIAEAGQDQIAMPGQELQFNGLQSQDPDHNQLNYFWLFGDGSSAEGPQPTHSYASPGHYQVTLRVQDDSGTPCNWHSDTLKVWVNRAPVASAGENRLVAPGENITLNGSRSFDQDGTLVSHTWDLADGRQLNGETVQLQYDVPGTYQVTLTVQDDAQVGNSMAQDSLTVVVNHPPIAEAGADIRVGVGETVNFDGSASRDPDGSVTSWQWNFGDGNQGQGQQIPYAYSNPGVYEVELTVLDNTPQAAGKHSDKLQVVVNDSPVAKIKVERLVTYSSIRFDASESYDPDGSISRYQWDFGDGQQGEGPNPIHTYQQSGVYTATLTVEDDSNTTTSRNHQQVPVVVNRRPTADAGPDPFPVAPHEPVRLSAAESMDPDGEIVSFEWKFSDEFETSGMDVEHAFERPGTYRAMLKVRDNTDDPKAVDYDEVIIRVNQQPVAKAGADIEAGPGQEFTLDGRQSFDQDGSILEYHWHLSDSGQLISKSMSKYSIQQSGYYVATLTVVDDSGASNGTAQDTVNIHINHAPQAVMPQDVFTCDSLIAFDGTQSVDADGDVLSYAWDFGDGTQGLGAKVKHLYREGGTFPVTLTVDDGTGFSNARHSNSMTVIINQPPNAVAGDHRMVCSGEPLILDASLSQDPEGGVLKFAWDFGEGSQSDLINPIKTYNKGGNYAVTLTVEDDSGLSCNADTDRISVQVADSPVAHAGEDQVTCANIPVKFDGSQSWDSDGVVNEFRWDFGDGSFSRGGVQEHIYKDAGEYYVVLTVTGDEVGHCDNTDTDEMKVTVHKAPVARIEVVDVTPVGVATTFDATSSSGEGSKIKEYHWDFGDGQTATGPKVNHVFAKAGKYKTTLTINTDATNICGTVSAQKTVVVNDPPEPNGGPDRLVGVNELVEFSAKDSHDPDGAILAYDWDFGDGHKASGILVRHRYQQSGTYQATLTVRDNTQVANNTQVDTIEVVVNSAPVPRITAPKAVCPTENVLFSGKESQDADGTIQSYEWNFGDGTTASGEDVTHSFQKVGHYNVTLTVTDDTDVLNQIQQTTSLVHVNMAPVAKAGADRLACPNQTIEFNGGASNDVDGRLMKFGWDFGDGTQKQGQAITHAYSKPGHYETTLTVQDDTATSCGIQSDVAKIHINHPPVAMAGDDQQGFTGGAHDALFFDGSASYDDDKDSLVYFWDFGDGGSATGARVYHYFSTPGEYKVTLTVQDSTGLPCGQSSDEVLVRIQQRS